MIGMTVMAAQNAWITMLVLAGLVGEPSELVNSKTCIYLFVGMFICYFIKDTLLFKRLGSGKIFLKEDT